MSLQVVTWNVNSLRSVLRKGFCDWLVATAPDVVCLQEVRADFEQLYPLESLFKGYRATWHPAQRPGYSGVAVLSRFKPLDVELGLDKNADPEGRALTVDLGPFRVGSFYAPNATPGTPKIPQKCDWLGRLKNHLRTRSDKPFIVAGDLNVAHTSLDSGGIRYPSHMNGCTDEERSAFQELLNAGLLCDHARKIAGDSLLSTWWPATVTGRSRSNGLRYDYIGVQDKYEHLIHDSVIHSEVVGSDHCPVRLTIDLSTVKLSSATERGQKLLF